jgi:tetratricopeptide (TPR) repeat protein
MKPFRMRYLLASVCLLGLLALGYSSWRGRRAPQPPDQAFALGEKLLEEGRFKEAYARLSYAARAQPLEARHHWMAAQAAARLGRAAAAAEHANEAWSRGLKTRDVFLLCMGDASLERRARLARGLAQLRELPEAPERRELEGDLLQSAGEHDEALRIWTALFEASPAPGLANKIALARVGRGNPEGAREILESRRSQGGLDEEGYGLLATLAAYRDDAEAAASIFAEGRARFEPSDGLRLSEAIFLIWRDRLQEAERLLEPLGSRVQDPARAALHAQARVFLGFLRGLQSDAAALDGLAALAAGEGPALEGERLYYHGLKERSTDSLRKARILLAGHPACVWALAREYARGGSWIDAASEYRTMAGLLASSPVLQMESAYAHRRAGKVDEALATLRRLHARGFYSRASLELFRDLASGKRLEPEAAQAQKLLEKKFGDDPTVILAGGILALHSGNLSEASSILDSLAARYPGREDVEQARLSVLFAARDYEGVLKAGPRGDASALPIQAAALAMLNRPDEACALYEKILAVRREPMGLVSYANLLLKLDRTDRAAELYGEAVRMDPRNAIAHLGCAAAAVRRRDFPSARQHAEAAAEAAPSLAYPHVLIAEIELAEGRPDRAAASCGRALAASPKDERAGYLLGVASLDLGRYEEAETLLKRCLAERPEAAAYAWQLARVRLARGALGEALSIVDAALSRRPPGEGAFHVLRLVLLARLGRAPEAREELARAAASVTPDLAVLCRAWLLQQEGRPADAEAHLRENLQHPHAAFAWGELRLMDGRTEGVVEALGRHPLDAPRWGRLGELARRQGDLATAAACYRHALESDSDNPQLLNNFAYASLQLETFDEVQVLAMARKATVVLPGNPSVLHTYATALVRCRREQECIDLLDKSPVLLQGSASLLQIHATAHERLRHWSLALKSYTACLAHPDTERVKTGDLSRDELRRRAGLMQSKLDR